MTSVFQRQIHAELPLAAGGKGVYIIDSEGKRYLDASGAAAVSCLGHGDADVIRAIKDQADRLAFAHTGFFTTEVAEELAARPRGRGAGGHRQRLFRFRRFPKPSRPP